MSKERVKMMTAVSEVAEQSASNLAINELNDVAAGLRTGVSKFSLQVA